MYRSRILNHYQVGEDIEVDHYSYNLAGTLGIDLFGTCGESCVLMDNGVWRVTS